ncbi:hypothetical protein CISIN_1g048473mg, partial [Citrus sinensis]
LLSPSSSFSFNIFFDHPLIFNQNSTMPSQLGNINNDYLETLVASARPFLRGELEAIDKNLPSLIVVLRSVGAGESTEGAHS